MPIKRTCLALAASVLVPQALLAQTTVPPSAVTAEQMDGKEQAPNKPMQRVEVKGSAADYDPRRDDTASKTIVNREELTKYGDNNVYEVLKRAPGVTVTGNVIRMRGLGTGYTQILVNGERPPPGFSLDNLNPDQIERIEIMRAATAEYSMQAIAGTINIVLRKLVSRPQRDIRVGMMNSARFKQHMAGGTWADKRGNLSYVVNASLFSSRNTFANSSTDELTLPSGQLAQLRETQSNAVVPSRGVALFPRLSWKLDGGDELNLQLVMQAFRSRSDGRWDIQNLVGSFPTPDWIEGHDRTPGNQRMMRGEVNWVAKRAGGKLEVTASADRGRNDSDSDTLRFTAGHALRLDRDWASVTQSRRHSLRGKFTRSLFDGHSLVTGLETSVENSDQTRDRREQLADDPIIHFVEYFSPRITRLAGFVQDEWNVTKQWSVYLGTRWEGVLTDSEGTGLQAASSRNHVLSPVAQTLYKFPGGSGRQLRLALTRTYKAPTTSQLTARRFESATNSRFNPDSGGNPALRPELATGIDLTYEHFWAAGALFSVSASRRSITDYIRTQLGLDDARRWLYQPVNDGTAQVSSLETELKLPLKLLAPSLDAIELRTSASRHWSRVATVPGPNNRLDAQTPLAATLGFDYRKGNLSFGSSLAFQKGGWVQVSEAQSQRQQSRRDLDAYVLWRLSPRYQLRLSLANILRADNVSDRLYNDAEGLSRETTFQPGVMRTGLNLEVKL
jgi:outer membrane receptor protein involved in Fe transport